MGQEYRSGLAGQFCLRVSYVQAFESSAGAKQPLPLVAHWDGW